MPSFLIDFVPIRNAVLCTGVFLYVLVNGFDLGVGILSRFAADNASRNSMMTSIAPVRHGNEVWLVLGGAGLLAAFPQAIQIIVSAVYIPVLIMLLALVLRGISLEFRFRVAPHRTFWKGGFFYGSVLATFAQGIVLGSFIRGFPVGGQAFTGSALDCFTPFCLLTGVALVFGYALLGAGWLIMKTSGSLQARSRWLGLWCLAGVVACIVAVSLWTPIMDTEIARRWFTWPSLAFVLPVPFITALIAMLTWLALQSDTDAGPFVGAVALFAMAYTGIAISLWPTLVPHHDSLWETASSPKTQTFLLLGTAFLLPSVLLYTAWSYWAFRGKVRTGQV